jgi:hypothetical protein
MTSDVIQQYEAALQRLINNQSALSGVKPSRDTVAKASLQKCSPSGKHPRPKVRAPQNTSQHVQTVKDEAN